MTKDLFVKTFEKIINDEDCHLVEVEVDMPDYPELEKIRNPRANFDKKLEYYKNSYDDCMCLKSFNKIKIVGIYGLQYLENDK